MRSTLSAPGRRAWMLAAAAAGIAGVGVAAWRREYAVAVVILVTLGVLVSAYLWGGGSEE
jgi:hypothetical protein